MARTSRPSSSSRSPGNMGVVPAAARLPRDAARGDDAARRAPRCSTRSSPASASDGSGRRAASGSPPTSRASARSSAAGMPLAAFGGRRGPHVDDRAGRTGLPGGNARPGTRSASPPAWRRSRALRGDRRRPTSGSRHSVRSGRASSARPLAASGRLVAYVNRVGSMLTHVPRRRPRCASYADASRLPTPDRFARLLPWACSTEGMYLPPSQFEAMFVSLAHDDEHVEQLGRAARLRARIAT